MLINNPINTKRGEDEVPYNIVKGHNRCKTRPLDVVLEKVNCTNQKEKASGFKCYGKWSKEGLNKS